MINTVIMKAILRLGQPVECEGSGHVFEVAERLESKVRDCGEKTSQQTSEQYLNKQHGV